MKAKTKAEQEILKYNEIENGKVEVVSLACGMAVGDTLLSCVPLTIVVLNSQITGCSLWYDLGIMYTQELIGSIPIVHIDDLCEAHIFCIEVSQIKGRFLCAAANVSSLDIANYFNQHFPDEFKIADEFRGEAGAKTTMDKSKLMKMGFVYKHDMKKILDDNVKCERRFGGLSQLATK